MRGFRGRGDIVIFCSGIKKFDISDVQASSYNNESLQIIQRLLWPWMQEGIHFLSKYSRTEPPLSGPPLSGTSIIRLGSFFLIRYNNLEMGLSLKCTCALQLLLWRQVCLSSAHAQTTRWHCCLSIKWVDQGVVYLFVYSVIRPASGTKVSG